MILKELFESVSSTVYHFTSLPAAAAILSDGNFRLTASSGTKTERDLARGREYYLSTTRSKVGDYTLHQFHKDGIVFELNGDWFNQRYRGGPVDYWGRNRSEGSGIKGRYKEMEDRVFSNEPYIPFPKNPQDLIKSMHILWAWKPHETQNNKWMRTVLIRAKQLGIPHFIYEDEQEFVLQDTRRAIKIDVNKLVNPDITKFGDNYPRTEKDWFKGYREIYYAKDKESLSKEAKRVADKIMYYRDDAVRGLDADIHNEKRKASPGLVNLLKIFRQIGVNSPQGFVDSMYKKWKPIYDAAEEKYWADIKKKREQEEKVTTEVAKIKLSKDPNDLGAYVSDSGKSEPTVMMPIRQINQVFEPDDLHQTKPGAAERIKKMVVAVRQGKVLPPILVRKYKMGYQVLDGHHRLKAYKLAKATKVPVRIVNPMNIKGDVE